MIKIAVYSPRRTEQRVWVFHQAELTIATDPWADVALPGPPDGGYFGVSVGRSESGLTLARRPLTREVRVAGAPLAGDVPAIVHKHDQVILGEHKIYIRETIPMQDASSLELAGAPFLGALRRAPLADPLRLVFADWLEEHGFESQAAYLRAQYALANMAPDASEDDVAVAAFDLREITPSVDARFRSLVAVQPVEGCPIAFKAPCPRRWADLLPTESEDIRSCGACKKNVYYCNTIQEAMLHAVSGDCVAVDPGVVRTPGDLVPYEPDSFWMGEPEGYHDELLDD